MSDKVQHPALRYYGGKFRLGWWIAGQFPAHDTYVEPFGGAAGVLLRKHPSPVEIYNDLDGRLVSFFRVLRENPQTLIRSLRRTPFSREEFDFLNPEESVFGIEDIAHGLSNICRFAGHSREFYSVAQHCVLVSENVPPEFALEGLLHDAAEAFIGDVTRPLKALLPDYKAIEKRVEAAVLGRFGIHEIPGCVKEADLMLLNAEQREFMAPHGDTWGCLVGVKRGGPDRIFPMDPKTAKRVFLQRFADLRGRKSPEGLR